MLLQLPARQLVFVTVYGRVRLQQYQISNNRSDTIPAELWIKPSIRNYREEDRRRRSLPTRIKTNIEEFIKRMEEMETYCRLEMQYSQALQEEYANQKRLPPPTYRVGDRGVVNETIHPDHTAFQQAGLQETREIQGS